MTVSLKNLDKNYEEDLSKELEKSCKVSKETKLSLEQKSDSDSDTDEKSEISEDFKNSGNIIWSFWKIKKENITFCNNIKKYYVCYNDIYTFYDTKNKSNNDLNNKIRENVIIAIVCNKIPLKWLFYSWWYNIHYKIHKTFKKLCKIKFNSIKIEHKAGRTNNFDFLVTYYYKNKKVYSVKIEFKHNSKTIEKCPQFLSMSSNNFSRQSYAEYFFDNYVEEICAIYEIKIPNKEEYLKNIYSTKYKSLPFFQYLYKNEKNSIDKFNKKGKLVKKSIRKFLEKDILDIKSLNQKLIETQKNKVFLLWDIQIFHIETIKPVELTCSTIKNIKNNNTIVLNTESKSEIHMLLRWKNHLGVLYPAWQISLKR
jgi:hypothetical protein